MQYIPPGSSSDFSSSEDIEPNQSRWAACNGLWAVDMVNACMIGCWAACIGVCSHCNGCNC